jgi:hypothetical protein
VVVVAAVVVAIATSHQTITAPRSAAGSHLSTQPIETLPVPTTGGVVTTPDGRASVAVCTSLGSLTASLPGDFTTVGPEPLKGASANVAALWLSGIITNKAYGYEVFVVTGANEFGVNDSDIATGVSRVIGAADTVLSQTPTHTVGNHAEFSFSQMRGTTEYDGHAWSHAGVVVLINVSYNRINGLAPFEAQARDELAKIGSTLSFPGLDGAPVGPTCTSPRRS